MIVNKTLTCFATKIKLLDTMSQVAYPPAGYAHGPGQGYELGKWGC